MHQKKWLEETNRMAMKHDPDFVVWGGDLAYDDGDPKKIGRVLDFFDAVACFLSLMAQFGNVSSGLLVDKSS